MTALPYGNFKMEELQPGTGYRFFCCFFFMGSARAFFDFRFFFLIWLTQHHLVICVPRPVADSQTPLS